ncbi:hypothetical protein G9H65_12820 [Cytophagaceae bacterium 50A-KIRBA]|nr:hypothetical protein [Aquirufa ecclesiirivi]
MMNAAVDEVLTLVKAMRVGVKNIGDSVVNHGFAKRNSPLMTDKKEVFLFLFLSKKRNTIRF